MRYSIVSGDTEGATSTGEAQVTQTICEVAISREFHNLAEKSCGFFDRVVSYFDCDFWVESP